MSLRFEYPEAFWGLLLVIALAGLMLWQARRRPKTFSFRRFGISILGFTALCLALARPQGGYYQTAQKGLRGDLYIAVDVSNSMRAQDIPPSRLDFATAFVRRLLQTLPGLRVALFPFAAEGYLQMPLSADREAAMDLMASLTPSITTNQGTDFESTLTALLSTIEKEKAKQREGAPTRVLLLSDGESHQKVSRGLLQRFRSRGIPIDTVGIGTQQGGLIPIESKWGNRLEPLRDEAGKPVLTRLDPKWLREIATETGGGSFGPHFEEAGKIAARIVRGMELGKLSTQFKLEQEYFPWCLLCALVLFSFEFICNPWQYWVKSLWIASLLSVPAWSWDSDIEKTLSRNPKQRPYSAYNQGLKLMEQGRVSDAAELFQESASAAKDPNLQKRAYYNLGNALIRLQDPTQALTAYQHAYDTHLANQDSEGQINQDISDNILLAKKLQQQQEQQQKEAQAKSGEGGEPDTSPTDAGEAKTFKLQQLDAAQKKRLFDLVTSEELQTLQRLQRGKNQKTQPSRGGQPW